MKYTLIGLLLLTLSCNKDIRKIKKEIYGTWELSRINRDIGTTNFLPGNGQKIIISKRGTYEMLNNDTSTFKGTYILKNDKTCNTSDILFSLTQNGTNNNSLFSIYFDGETLNFQTPSCYSDITTASYRKL